MDAARAAARANAVRAGSMQAWAVAARPRSLPIAVAPVVAGVALGWSRTGAFDTFSALLALGAALLMQLVTNLQNDVGYTVRGGERAAPRQGLPRATARGWLAVRHVRIAIAWCAAAATGIGIALAMRRGWPVIAIGVGSLAAAMAYMAGPRPIAYTPFGELTVLVFFGAVGTCGADWVVTGSVGAGTVIASAAIGGLSAAALAANNHRDVSHDRSAGRRTFVVCFGERASSRLYATLLLAPFALVPPIVAVTGAPALLLPLALVPTALRLRRAFEACVSGPTYDTVLFRTFRLSLGFATLLAVGAVLSR